MQGLLRKSIVASVLFLGLGISAHAATFGIRNPGTGAGHDGSFVPGLFRGIDVTIDFGSAGVNAPIGVRSYTDFDAGLYNLEFSSNPQDANPAWQTLRTYCIEITQFVDFPGLYVDATLASAIGTANNRDIQVQRLWAARAADSQSLSSTEFDLVAGATAADRAAAFQVALWEIEADGGTDLDSGVFQLDSVGAVRDLAVKYLAIAQTPGQPDQIASSLFALVSELSQDLLIAPTGPGSPSGATDPVPAPATLLLMGAALAGLGTLRKRKKA